MRVPFAAANVEPWPGEEPPRQMKTFLKSYRQFQEILDLPGNLPLLRPMQRVASRIQAKVN
jgi:hypothetical protein